MLPVSSLVAIGFLESIGTSELFLILVAALVIFGPRKLPELSRSLGRGISEFKRASDEFKQTWEHAAEMERAAGVAAPAVATPPTEQQPAEVSVATADTAPTSAPAEQARVAA